MEAPRQSLPEAKRLDISGILENIDRWNNEPEVREAHEDELWRKESAFEPFDPAKHGYLGKPDSERTDNEIPGG
jgi:hypothetical protein